jgi:inorganic triphosphatase YgiF
METELRFALSPDARRTIERYVASHDEAASLAGSRTERTTYYDTSDFALRQAGLGLAIGHRADDPGKSVQIVKTGGDGSSLHHQKWEWSIADAAPERARLEEVPGLLSVLKNGGDLQPIFHADVRRCRRLLHPDGGNVELTLDEGVVVAERQSEPLSELALELKQGSEESLLHLGLELVQAAPLSLQIESTADHGYRLCNGHGLRAHKAVPVAVDPQVSAADGFARLAASVLAHLLVNQPAALRGEQAEGVHQMRVAIRRLRTLLVLFAPLIEEHGRRRFTGELRRLGDCLGRARDWDVLASETLPRAEADGVDRGWTEPLRIAAEEQRHAAHQAAKKAIGEPEFARFVLAFRLWSGGAVAALLPRARDLPLRRTASSLLDRLENKVVRRLDRSDADDPASLHALRKSVKKLRYGIEYLDVLFGREPRRYLKHANALQKKLGALNDLETAQHRLAGLAGDGRLDLVPATGALINWVEARRPKLLEKALKARATYCREDPFWR